MTSTTVAEFANELKKSPETLLEQLQAAGVAKAAGADTLSESDKQKLLGYLQASVRMALTRRPLMTKATSLLWKPVLNPARRMPNSCAARKKSAARPM